MIKALRIATILAALISAGCSGARPVQTQVMLNHQNCQTLEAGITEVGLERIAQIRGSRLLSLNAEIAAPPGADSQAPAKGYGLFAISKGPAPTPGYSMELLGADLSAQLLRVYVQWNEPPADAMLATVVTHPCLVVALPVTEATELLVLLNERELDRIPLPGAASPAP